MQSFALLPLLAAVISAQDPGDDVPYNCAKPNAQYCLEGDIILRCNGSAIGYPGRCSANLSGYPPAGGSAWCWQSGEETGDAACVKNCVVHAEELFTLPADECTPSYTTSMPSNITSTIVTITTSGPPVITDTIPSSSTEIEAPPVPMPTVTGVITDPILSSLTPVPLPSATEVITDPNLSSLLPVPLPSATGVITDPVWPPSNSTTTLITITECPGGCPMPSGSDSATNVPIPPPSPTSTGTVPAGGAATNQAAGVLVAIGLAAAYIL